MGVLSIGEHVDPVSTEGDRSENPVVQRRGGFREFCEIVAITAMVALALRMFVIEAYRIPTGSMEPTLRAGDFLLVSKFTYGPSTPRYLPFTSVAIPQLGLPAFADPRRGDIMVFRLPGTNDTHYVKRCIAVPGDEISIVNGAVFVNGLLVRRVGGSERVFPLRAHTGRMEAFRLPHEGDEITIDATNIGMWRQLIEREGHTVTVTRGHDVLLDGVPSRSYSVKHDYYFMLGDNINNSHDSRAWGPVPGNLVIGKAFMVYWSWESPQYGSSVLDRLRSIRWERVGTIPK